MFYRNSTNVVQPKFHQFRPRFNERTNSDCDQRVLMLWEKTVQTLERVQDLGRNATDVGGLYWLIPNATFENSHQWIVARLMHQTVSVVNDYFSTMSVSEKSDEF